MNMGPRIVRSGLVLNLDAGQKTSYSGSGTTWNDLSGNRNNGTLTNGPTFNAANSGYFSFDGTNDYVTINYALTNLNGTVSIWVYCSATNGNFFGSFGNGYSHHLGISTSNKLVGYIWDGGAKIITGSTSMSLNTWYYVTMTWVSNGNFSIYLNGISDATPIAIGNVWQGGTETRIASQTGNNGQPYAYMNGKVANALLYNRALSATEILQNYNATKGRFGL